VVGASDPRGVVDMGERALGAPAPSTRRLVQILEFASNECMNRAIASKLPLSSHTVARHLSNARGKLGASNRAEAATRLAGLRSHALSEDA
jgi:DNA-binding NarL/FixJ family response regulator